MQVQIFTKIDRERDQYRWYTIAWGQDLFGQWTVVRTWGRLGSDWSRQRVDEFDTSDQAAAEAQAQIERREKRGYKSYNGDRH